VRLFLRVKAFLSEEAPLLKQPKAEIRFNLNTILNSKSVPGVELKV
jgi:hypothetical protein